MTIKAPPLRITRDIPRDTPEKPRPLPLMREITCRRRILRKYSPIIRRSQRSDQSLSRLSNLIAIQQEALRTGKVGFKSAQEKIGVVEVKVIRVSDTQYQIRMGWAICYTSGGGWQSNAFSQKRWRSKGSSSLFKSDIPDKNRERHLLDARLAMPEHEMCIVVRNSGADHIDLLETFPSGKHSDLSFIPKRARQYIETIIGDLRTRIIDSHKAQTPQTV